MHCRRVTTSKSRGPIKKHANSEGNGPHPSERRGWRGPKGPVRVGGRPSEQEQPTNFLLAKRVSVTVHTNHRIPLPFSRYQPTKPNQPTRQPIKRQREVGAPRLLLTPLRTISTNASTENPAQSTSSSTPSAAHLASSSSWSAVYLPLSDCTYFLGANLLGISMEHFLR